MKYALFAISKGGKELAEKLAVSLDAEVIAAEDGIQQAMAEQWNQVRGLICIMSTGIVVRSIAPRITDKKSDPAVVVLDQRGKHVISLLSGHLGGGNELARIVAELTGGEAVITTASDTLNLTPLDLWAKSQGLYAARKDMTRASAILVNKGKLALYSEVIVESLPQGLYTSSDKHHYDIIISPRKIPGRIVFHPQNIVIGIGCNRNAPAREFEDALRELLHNLQISPSAIRNLASIDLKNDETGLLEFAENNNWSIDFFNRTEINKVSNVEVSSAAMKAVGAIGVAEPCALLSAAEQQTPQLFSRKRKWKNITMAMAQAPFTLSAQVLAPQSI